MQLKIFRGVPYQRGHGLGNIIGSLFKRAVPLFKSGLNVVAPHVAEAGLNMLSDITRGENVGESLKRHARQAALNTIETQLLKRQKVSQKTTKRPVINQAVTKRAVTKRAVTKRRQKGRGRCRMKQKGRCRMTQKGRGYKRKRKSDIRKRRKTKLTNDIFN